MTTRFVSPRHLWIAFKYLLAASVATVLAFRSIPQYPALAVACAWPAVTFILVAASYALGANGFLRKSRSGYAPLTWLLYWPYLLGSAVNWRFWRRRIPLMAEVASGVWIGARPGSRDWDTVNAKQVGAVVDLVPELTSLPPSHMTHAHFPLLDVAIPDPAALDRIAAAIDESVVKGGVLIHCALGMSRSVLAVCAWMVRNGLTPSEAFDAVSAARPERVARPYMTIALDLYADYLAQRGPVRQQPAPNMPMGRLQ